MEEVFQVIHKATLQAIHEDAMLRNRMTMGLAQHMYQRVQNLVRKIISDRRTTATKERFVRTWVRPGYVVTGEQGADCLGVRMWEPGFKKSEKGERATGRRQEEDIGLEIPGEESSAKRGRGPGHQPAPNALGHPGPQSVETASQPSEQFVAHSSAGAS